MAARRPNRGREIGPIGTATRIIAGLVLIAVPIASHGIGIWDLGGALIVFPLLAIALHRLVSWGFANIWLVNLLVLVLALAIATGLTVVTPIDGGAIPLFFGASLLVVAVRGDAGCEVLAFANASTGHRDVTGCVAFSPLDWLEDRLASAGGFTPRRPRGQDVDGGRA